MSFIFGQANTDTLGVIATLRTFPSLAGLQLETLEAPGTDGLVLGGSTQTSAAFVFDVIVKGATTEAVAAKRDGLVLLLDPKRGQQYLRFDAAPGWRWLAIPSGGIDWERVMWIPGSYMLRADLSFEALGAYGRLVTDEQWTYTTPGTRSIQRAEGNTSSFPTVEIEGTLTAGQTVTVSVGGVTVTVTGPLLAGEVLRLNWDTFDFARWAGSTKKASVVRMMSTLDRPILWPATASNFTVSTTGTVTAIRLKANSRRQ